jgi:hypothetical protein
MVPSTKRYEFRRCFTEDKGECVEKSGGFHQEFVKEVSFRNPQSQPLHASLLNSPGLFLVFSWVTGNTEVISLPVPVSTDKRPCDQLRLDSRLSPTRKLTDALLAFK